MSYFRHLFTNRVRLICNHWDLSIEALIDHKDNPLAGLFLFWIQRPRREDDIRVPGRSQRQPLRGLFCFILCGAFLSGATTHARSI